MPCLQLQPTPSALQGFKLAPTCSYFSQSSVIGATSTKHLTPTLRHNRTVSRLLAALDIGQEEVRNTVPVASSNMQFQSTILLRNFYFLLILLPVHTEYTCTKRNEFKRNCKLYEFFSSPGCFPWNKSQCPNPHVVHKWSHCPVYDCIWLVSYGYRDKKCVNIYPYILCVGGSYTLTSI